MSVDPNVGPRYVPPPPDSVSPPGEDFAGDAGFQAPALRPGEEEAGPLYLSPEAQEWVRRNVTDPDYVIDWGTREVIDPDTGEVKGTVPRSFPRMI